MTRRQKHKHMKRPRSWHHGKKSGRVYLNAIRKMGWTLGDRT